MGHAHAGRDRDAEAKLTAKESRAVDDLVEAVKRLPKNFCLSVDDEGFFVQKRITRGFAQNVGSVDVTAAGAGVIRVKRNPARNCSRAGPTTTTKGVQS